MKQRLSKEFKEFIIQKIMTPGGPTIMQMSVKTGIGHGSIRNWIKLYANPSSMKNLKEWSPEEKLEIIMKTFFMSENELGEFLRPAVFIQLILSSGNKTFTALKGPWGVQSLILNWLVACKGKRAPSKDKALAEMAAKIILIKKVSFYSGRARKTNKFQRKRININSHYRGR